MHVGANTCRACIRIRVNTGKYSWGIIYILVSCQGVIFSGGGVLCDQLRFRWEILQICDCDFWCSSRDVHSPCLLLAPGPPELHGHVRLRPISNIPEARHSTTRSKLLEVQAGIRRHGGLQDSRPISHPHSPPPTNLPTLAFVSGFLEKTGNRERANRALAIVL